MGYDIKNPECVSALKQHTVKVRFHHGLSKNTDQLEFGGFAELKIDNGQWTIKESLRDDFKKTKYI